MASCNVCDTYSPSLAEVRQHKKVVGHFACPVCSKAFASHQAVEQHRAARHSPTECPICGVVFANAKTLAKHQRQADHCYCGDCDRTFGKQSKLNKHLRKTLHPTEFRCCDCDRDFPSFQALSQHLIDKIYASKEEKKERTPGMKNDTPVAPKQKKKKMKKEEKQESPDMINGNPGASKEKKKKKKEKKQESPDKISDNTGAPKQEKEQKMPDTSSDSSEPPRKQQFVCEECSRPFQTSSGLQHHLDSLKHKPLAQLSCFMGCGKANFPSPSALMAHLESGGCSSGMTLDKIRDVVIQQDKERLITAPPVNEVKDMLVQVNRRLLSGVTTTTTTTTTDSQVSTPIADSDGGVPILTPATGDTPSTFNTRGILTPMDGNDRDWAMLLSQALTPANRCPFCPPHRPPFSSADGLRCHLQSAAHADPFLFCPADLAAAKGEATAGKGRTMRSFKTVSSLAQHLESASCAGGMNTFEKAFEELARRLMTLGLNVPSASSSGITLPGQEDSRAKGLLAE